MITKTKSTGDETSDQDNVKSESFVSDDSEIEPSVKKQEDSAFHSIMLHLKLLDKNETKKAALILKKNYSNSISINEENNDLHIDDEPRGMKVTSFLHN